MLRSVLKQVLAAAPERRGRTESPEVTLLTYHRVGGGSRDELDIPSGVLAAHLDALVEGQHTVVSLDEGLIRLDVGDRRAAVVLTFDDGFAEVHSEAFPLLRDRGLPFTLYVAAGLVGRTMSWPGSTAGSQGARSLSWDQIGEMVDSGLCTVGNHTFTHARPDLVDVEELDRCSEAIERELGRRPDHFAWTWGVPVPGLMDPVRDRFRSVATGEVGRNFSPDDRYALKRVPVRASDPLAFFKAKLTGSLGPERAYAGIVAATKRPWRAIQRG